ncbi:MAG: aspartate aminotransferase family protein [Bdellovibrionia bacterium]
MASLPGKKTIKYPDGHVILRNLDKEFPIISHGEGIYLYDAAGKKYLDAAGGALVVSVGHGNQDVIRRITNQMNKVAYVNGTQFTSQAAEDLAARLALLSPDSDLNRACFLSSGSEAVEAAVKFVRQLWVDRGKSERYKLIARIPSYHGNTLYALSASGRPHYKKYYGPLLNEVITVSAPYEYRSPVLDYAKEGADFYAAELETTILKEGPETIAAFIFEPVIGSSTGGSLPPPGYFKKVEEVCRKYQILMIADEVMCGSGRTGKFFASQHFDFKPDLIVLGKGISSGYVALSAVMVKDAHLREIKTSTGYFMHAQTYLQAPSMVAAGVAVLDYFEKHRCVENSELRGEQLHRRLHEELDSLQYVGCVSGKGLLAGVEFVEDKKSKKPFARNKKVAEKFTSFAFERGLILWPNVGQADGVNGDLVVFGPPLIINEAQIEELVTLLKDCVIAFFQSSFLK